MILLDGQPCPDGFGTFRLEDPVLWTGMAVFETLRTRGGRPFRLEAHLERLQASARHCGIPWHEAVGAELEQLVVAALFRAFAAGRELTQEDLSRVARESVPLAVTMDDRLKELREWARPRARPASVDTRRMSWFTEWDE